MPLRGGVSVILFSIAAAAQDSVPPISIRGPVFADDTGDPSRGAKVALTLYNQFRFRSRAGETSTDAEGGFVFDGITPGRYSNYVEKPDYLPATISSAAPASEIVVRLRRAATISGCVVDSNGGVIRKALVEVLTNNYTYGSFH
jgi:protocatechuate 3,4-dioxygenase beta subunit